MDKLFLDANVLFSAAYNPKSTLLKLWQLDEVELISSVYAVGEARRNLAEYDADKLPALGALTENMTVVLASDPAMGVTTNGRLPRKDAPILAAAIQTAATHLLTGDMAHFASLFGTEIAGVTVQRPSDYIHGRRKHTKAAEET